MGVVGLALAVGGLTLSSITSSIGGGGGGGGSTGKAREPVRQLLDRVPQPLPVTRKAEEAASQINSKGEARSARFWPLVLPSACHKHGQLIIIGGMLI